jgi:hypothetical protein
MVTEEMGNVLGIKGPNKRENLRQLASYYMRIFKNDFLKNGVEGICDIHL